MESGSTRVLVDIMTKRGRVNVEYATFFLYSPSLLWDQWKESDKTNATAIRTWIFEKLESMRNIPFDDISVVTLFWRGYKLTFEIERRH